MADLRIWLLTVVLLFSSAGPSHALLVATVYDGMRVGGDLSGDSGGTVGWGVELYNPDLTHWVLLTGTSFRMTGGTDNRRFNASFYGQALFHLDGL